MYTCICIFIMFFVKGRTNQLQPYLWDKHSLISIVMFFIFCNQITPLLFLYIIEVSGIYTMVPTLLNLLFILQIWLKILPSLSTKILSKLLVRKVKRYVWKIRDSYVKINSNLNYLSHYVISTFWIKGDITTTRIFRIKNLMRY